MDDRYSECETKMNQQTMKRHNLLNNEQIEERKKKYIVYRNDLKNRKYNKINPDKAIWSEEGLKDIYENVDTDSVTYRIDECRQENFDYIDLSHLDQAKVNEFFASQFYKENKERILHLFISSCDMEYLPNIRDMKNLETLEVSNNKLTKLTKLPHSLVELVASNNKLTKINSKLRNVKRLDVSFNELSKLVDMRSATYINISGNKFKKFVSVCPRAEELNVSKNPLTEISHKSLPLLEKLNISYTNIENVEKFTNLVFLTGTMSKLKMFKKLDRIHTIDIAETKISKIPYQPSLECLIIHDNPNMEIDRRYVIENHMKNKNDTWCISFKTKMTDEQRGITDDQRSEMEPVMGINRTEEEPRLSEADITT